MNKDKQDDSKPKSEAGESKKKTKEKKEEEKSKDEKDKKDDKDKDKKEEKKEDKEKEEKDKLEKGSQDDKDKKGAAPSISITKDASASQAPQSADEKAKAINAAACADPAKLLAESEQKAAEAAKKIEVEAFIRRHLIAGSKRMDYELDEIHALLDLAKLAFLKSPSLLEVQSPVNVCGDIHGQYGDLFRIFNACGLPFKKKYLFLGDYVDRGRHSLEVICLLLALRVHCDNRVFLLRGNHELANINKVYGFQADIRNRYRAGTEWKTLYDHFNEVFAVMPLAAVINRKILCMHGGLSPELNNLDDIKKIQRPILIARGLAQDLLWADPEMGVKGFQVNKIRAVSHVFGEDAVASKCKQLSINMVIRAHQVVEFGYAFFANKMLVTVFSASRYHEDLWNFAGVVIVDKNLELSFKQLKPTEYEQYRQDRQVLAQSTGDPGDEEDDK